MKKTFILLFFLTLLINENYGDGIKTKLCQSAASIRNPSQGATLRIDGAYFNPAGTAFLNTGWHFSLNNQSALKGYKMQTDLYGLNVTDFSDEYFMLFSPTFFIVRKFDKLALSFGYLNNLYENKAIFDSGLPSYEVRILNVLNEFNNYMIHYTPLTVYSHNSYFRQKSFSREFLLSSAYNLTNKIGISIGLKYIFSKNSFTGSFKDVMIERNSNMLDAEDFFSDIAGMAHSLAITTQDLINSGAGNFTLHQVQTAGFISSAEQAQLEAGLSGVYTSAQIAAMNIIQVNDAFHLMESNMLFYTDQVSDMNVDIKQNGGGIAPVIGFTYKHSDNFTIGFRYEMKTVINLQTKSLNSDNDLYKNNEKVHSDIPSIISTGINYKILPKLALSGTYVHYFDKTANYGKKINGNYFNNSAFISKNINEISLGAEYQIHEKFFVSLGYLHSKKIVNSKFQNELDFSLTSKNLCGGIRFDYSEKTALNLGFMNTWYKTAEHLFSNPTHTMIFDQKRFIIAIGVDIII